VSVESRRVGGTGRAIFDERATAASNSSANSNAVTTLNQGASSEYDQTQMQQVMDKLDELINALRR
jgi:hypothetical protein